MGMTVNCPRPARGEGLTQIGTMVSDGRGFTLVELMLVVGLIGILLAIVVPSLLRARMSANEASVISSLRIISSAQATFAASCSSGFYAPTLVLLGTPPGPDRPAFIGPDLNTDPSFKATYTLSLTAGSVAVGAPAPCNGAVAGMVVATYFADAAPANIGFRFFGSNQGGIIYEDRAALPVTHSGAPAGATPIQ
jgi:prepilin-type N-terminal cleavage/methylation domain-containing protein